MMNTVKYRALAKDGTWRYGCYPCLNVDMGNAKYPMDIFWNNFLSAFRRETLGQWTGLLDKQGKEIYEGDIVEYSPAYTRDRFVVSITFNDEHACFAMKGIEKWDCSFVKPNPIEFEVIGNIYENPELLVVAC